MDATQPGNGSNTRPPLKGRLTDPPFTEASGAQPNAITAADIVPAHLLDGGEIVIFAIKPSLWFVVFRSARWLLAVLFVLMAVVYFKVYLPWNPALIMQGALGVAALRLGFALLQWVSRLYVLTNRRIMRLTGILNVDLFECALTKIQNTHLRMTWYERLTGLGTISFATAGTGGVEASWTNVNNPLEIHERVRSAIHRARTPGSGL
jgi:uncharacterized membrane protein YdbT with pleckstrin-like domain